MKDSNITKSRSRGFSLIELSIVILIIGLVVLGVMGGQKLLNLSRLSAARALTNSSPVAGIENLALWLETTSKSSFNAGVAIDGTSVSTWHDINTQLTDKIDFVTDTLNLSGNGTPPTQPVYTSNAANGLPALVFNASSLISSSIPVSRITSSNGETTIIVVVKNDGTGSQPGFFFFWDGSANRLGFDFSYPSMIWNSGTCCTNRPSASYASFKGNWVIVTGVSSVSNGVSFRINGAVQGSSASMSPAIPSSTVAQVSIGGGTSTYLSGGVGEVIVFSRTLSATEIGYVEQYLSKKWKITLS